MPDLLAHSAILHNELVRLGRHVTSAPFVTYWAKYSQHQAEMRSVLREDVVNFYKQALVPAEDPSAEDPYQNFFYYLHRLARPRREHENRRLNDRVSHEAARFVLFYIATDVFSGQQGGLMRVRCDAPTRYALLTLGSLDQENGQVSMQTDLSLADNFSMVWQPLSTMLITFLDLVTIGKITASGFRNDPIMLCEAAPQYPWKYHSYSLEILRNTLAAYHGLITAIEAARGTPHEEGKMHELTVCLSTHFNLDVAAFPKNCFVRSFLTAARRPRGPNRIRFIAPGIELPTSISIRKQPFRAVARRNRFASAVAGLPSVNLEEGTDPLYPPFLLFPGEGTKLNQKLAGDLPVFAAPFDALELCPVGLWLDRAEPWAGRGGEDEAVIVTPFDCSRRLCTPFEVGTGLSLCKVLERWTEMVQSGAWNVDERGVTGGIGLLREGGEIDEPRGRSRIRKTTTSTSSVGAFDDVYGSLF